MKKQHKLLLLFFILICFFKSYSQQYEVNLSPEGKLETIYDNQGNQLKLKDILIDTPKESGYLKASNVTCSTTSYFNLYFEPGCGMEDTTNPIHNERRAVICKVFEDVSNFIISPLSITGNKVNIWVRNIANINVPSGTLGLASSFYLPSPNVGGILDGEIWKTIHLGVDSYTNVLNGTNLFYHGRVAFNFNDSNINWNTNLSINSPSNLYDLYTVILHEVVHSLGFGSFINQNGNSIDPFPYYSRYDTFLKTNNNVPLLTIGSCSMYDISFNSAVSPTVLRPGCTLPNNLSNGVLNNTACNNAIKYVGSSTVPVYTPICFEQGSSLSHFEDMIYPSCASPYGNDNYFALSNAITVGKTKRYLKPEERNVLCDIGYNVKTTFGVSSTSGGYFNYGGTACAGISVAGLNDGINSNGDYTFVGNANSSIIINGAAILNNDINASGFECLQDISAISTFSATSGNISTNINFSSATTGLHILRYVPINGTKRGNITYVYLYIRVPVSTNSCNPTPSACNLVMNGNFEEFSSISAIPTIKKACGWDSVYQLPPNIGDGSAVAKYFSSTSNPTFPSSRVPCNWVGYQVSNNNIGNGYANLTGRQHIYTRLNSILQPNTNYQLSFDVSLADGFSYWASNLQAFLHRSNTNPPSILAYNSNGDVSIINNASDTTTQLISPTITRNTNGWDTIIFNFTTTTGGEQFLYLGLLNNATLVPNTPAATGIGGCNYQSTASNGIGNNLISYYIDNVSLIPTNGVIFNLPASICSTQSLNDLSIYISGTTPNGIFFGSGVTLINGIYSFNASLAEGNTSTIGYTFTNSSGCSTTIYDIININTTSSNTIVVNAINDDFSTMPIFGSTGGVTTSVYANDIYNGVASSSATLPNVIFTLVSSPISGASINSSGLISIPVGTPEGTYTLTYRLNVIGNCNSFDIATVTLVVTNNSPTPPLVAGIRANNTVNHIELQNTGKSIISGNFTKYNNISRPYIARLNTNLTLDQTFIFTGNQGAMDMAIQSDNKIIVATWWNANFGGTSVGVNRLLVDGAVDTTFNNGGAGISELSGYASNLAFVCALQSDGRILLGGDFYYYNGIKRLGIVRIDNNGSIDTSFNPSDLNNYYRSVVTGITIQPDGKILLLGFFSPPTAGAIQKNIIRLNANGTIDTTFFAGDTVGSLSYNGVLGTSLYSPITKAVVQPDGKIIIAGGFNKYNAANVKCLVRLTDTGTIDASFNTATGVDRAINELILEPITNKPIIGGEFTSFGTTSIKKLIRLTTTGTLDTTFSIGTGTTDSVTYPSCQYCSNYVKALKQQPDGKIIVGGKFTTFNGLSATNITRIFGSAGMQAKSSILEYQSEPEIDINPNFNDITIYPNPSKGIYIIDLSNEKKSTTIAIYNVLGELVYKQFLTPQTQNQIDLTHIASGYYIARINNESCSTQQKIIKN